MQATVGDETTLVARTQRVDLARAVPLGVLLPLETSVMLTIAIKHFDAAPIVKGLIACAGGIGLVVSPFLTSLTRRLRLRAMAMSSIVAIAGTVGLLLAATGPLVLFVIGAVVGLAALNATLPLLTFVYERNFPAFERGRRVGRGLAMRVAVSAPLSILMGAWLTTRLDQWWLVVLAGAAAYALLAWLYRHMPSATLDAPEQADARLRPWPHFELLGHDRQLRLTLMAWMLMGFGNLMLLPLRIEYLAQPKYGIEADAATITLLTVAIPSVVRLACTPLFGRLFDRLSFFSARIMINVLFAVYVAAFFGGSSDIALWTGAVTLGIAIGGGDLMWMLWVTKFAPPGRVADYMGLHTFFTGLRAVCAPLLAFLVVERLSLGWIAALSAALMIVSSAVLVPEARADRRRRADDLATG